MKLQPILLVLSGGFLTGFKLHVSDSKLTLEK